jgi:predicted porin
MEMLMEMGMKERKKRGIIIPAGEWTFDVGGNVNAYANFIDADAIKGSVITGAIANSQDALGESKSQGINTGLLPAWLGFTGTTRQNDLDVSFTISMQPNVSDNSAPHHGDSKTPLNRQAFLTFGDASWGSIKLGKDLGIFASDAILNDMTLLGVGSGATGRSGADTTLGGIGTGYVYAAWKGQFAYTTPNMNGFQATVGLTNPNNIHDATTTDSSGTGGAAAGAINQDRFGVEAKASYSLTGDVAGKFWVSGASYNVKRIQAGTTADEQSYDITAFDVGVSISAGNLGFVGYYYIGDGLGTTYFGTNGVTVGGAKRDSDGGYGQATYVIPTGTKLGVAYGISTLDTASGETNGTLVEENERWTVGAYHPLTKHLNLVAEYNSTKSKGQSSLNSGESDAVSLGAILFF